MDEEDKRKRDFSLLVLLTWYFHLNNTVGFRGIMEKIYVFIEKGRSIGWA
jgi:hypothetical protein